MKQLQSVVLMGFMLWGWLMMPPFVQASDDFANWQRQMMQDFQEFKDERDRKFTAFLKAHWREMRLLYGVVRDRTPKPKVIPKVKPRDHIKPSPQLPPTRPPVVAPVLPRPEPPAPPITIPDKGTRIKVAFCGHQLPFHMDSVFEAPFGHSINEQVISDYWAKLSRADYEPLLKQLDTQRHALQLNDWAYLLLVHQIAKKLHPNRSNEQMLLIWFLLSKNGYRARIAYDSQQVYLFMPTKQMLYAVSYFTFDGMRYYAIPFDGSDRQQIGQVRTYDGHYPGATEVLDMRFSTAVVTRSQPEARPLAFRYKGKSHQINVKFDRQTVAFLHTYPQMEIGVYFISTVHPETGKQLLEQLRPLITGQSELEAVNLLLRFVQTAFEYKTDKEQFNKENYLFPEETLFYPYSDCEDRSVLFAWLVRNLLGLDMIGLSYPGHIAAAVHFNGQVGGDSVTYRGKHYMVTDPTFINANVGMTMPQYRKTAPEVVPIL